MFLWKRLSLRAHPRKIILRKFRQGIDFLGYVLLPRHRVLRTNTKRRMFKKMNQRVGEYNCGIIDAYSFGQSAQSYLGILKHCSGYGLSEKLKNEAWLASDARVAC